MVKNAFQRSLGKTILNYDSFITFLCEVEGTLNMRPLTYVSDEHDSFIPLRPLDSINPHATTFLPVPTHEKQKYPSNQAQAIEAWNITNNLLNKFWNRWKTEYLTHLKQQINIKHKGPHLTTSSFPTLNEIVIISEPFMPRNLWKLGKIIEKPDRNIIRSVKIKTVNGRILHRSINRLYPLELEHDIIPTTTVNSTKNNTNKNTYKINNIITSSLSNILLLTILFLSIFTYVESTNNKEQLVQCTHYGLQIFSEPNIVKIEVCCPLNTCHEYSQTKELQITLPEEIIVNSYLCNINYFKTDFTIQTQFQKQCPANNICSIKNCWFCLDTFTNPECHPIFLSIAIGIIISISVVTTTTTPVSSGNFLSFR